MTPLDEPAPSPFLPGTNIQFAWDSTSLGLVKTCPKLYYYTMIEGYRPKGESVHLRFGSEFHQALWDYDTARADGAAHEDAVLSAINDLLCRTTDFHPPEDTKAGKYKNRNSLVRSVIYYLDHRSEDNLKTYRLADGTAAVELSFRFELEYAPQDSTSPYLLCGHLDRVAEDPNGDLFVEDHKTTTTTPGSYFFDQFEPNNQMSLYAFAGRIVLDAPITGVIINAVQLLIEPPFNRFVRGFTFRNTDQLEEWAVDLSRWFQLAEWYASNNEWPQNDTACDKYGGCRFRKVCSKAPGVRHIYLNSDFDKLSPEERWNPLRNR